MLTKEMDYNSKFNEAISLTKNLGLLKTENIIYPENIIDLNIIRSYLKNYIFNYQRLTLKDLANNCITYNSRAQKFIYENFKITPELTIGNLYLKDGSKLKVYNYESTEKIIARTLNLNNHKFGGHVWLTLNKNIIIDVTIYPSFWYERFIKNDPKNILEETERNPIFYKEIVCASLSNIYKNNILYYEPIIIGEEYLKKSNLTS